MMATRMQDLKQTPLAKLQEQQEKAFAELQPEQEGMGKDVSLDGLKLQMKNYGYILIDDVITSASLERTVEGASTLTITISDQPRALQKTRFVGSNVDVNVDGLWFRLVHVSKNEDDITLTFEDREVAALRVKA